MHSKDVLYGQIRNGVLTLSGNNPSVRVDSGGLVVSDGPHIVPSDWKGEAPPLKDRMVTLRLPRAECGPGRTLERIVATRPDGFITFAAARLLYETGVAFVQLGMRGEVIASIAPPGPDQPAARRQQALAAGGETGVAVMREILRAKLKGQSQVARLLGGDDTAASIERLADDIARCGDGERMLSIEAAAAAGYWPLWADVPVRLARADKAPDHWLRFGSRQSPISASPRKATTPGGAVLNYLHGVCAGEMTAALAAAGLDPGIGIFHADKDRRPSLAYDAVEACRPYVEGWFLSMIAEAAFAKRDFFEEPDGAIRLTRPLSSWLAMTAPLWRRASETVAEWLADSFMRIARAARQGMELEEAIDPAAAGLPVPMTPAAARRQASALPPPLPQFPAPGRAYRSALAHAVVPRACHECGRALADPRPRTRFCSRDCANTYAGAMRSLGDDRPRQLPAALARVRQEARQTPTAIAAAAKYEWERTHKVEAHGLDDRRTGADRAQLADWYEVEVKPRVASFKAAEIARACSISDAYARAVMHGRMPHPRHFGALAALVGIEPPEIP